MGQFRDADFWLRSVWLMTYPFLVAWHSKQSSQALRKTEQGVAPNPSNGPIFLHGISHRFPMDFTSIPRGWPCLTGGTQKANHFLHRSQVPPAKLSCTDKHFNLPGLGVCPTSFKGKSQNICQNNHFIIHYPWRIHGAAIYIYIYGNMDPINIPPSC